MAANFPKLPGFVPTHDPTIVDHKKISHIKLEKIRNAKNVDVPLHALPRQVEKIFLPDKTDMSKSLSHVQYPNHQGANLGELFEPTFVKLDKQVSTINPINNFFWSMPCWELCWSKIKPIWLLNFKNSSVSLMTSMRQRVQTNMSQWIWTRIGHTSHY